MVNPMKTVQYEKPIAIDDWVPAKEDEIFKHTKNKIMLPVSRFYNIFPEDIFLDSFVLNAKRCYNSDEIREHCTHYLNYFEKFYDLDKELLVTYFKIKYLIDYEPSYNTDAFMYDIKTYIFSQSLMYKVELLNRDNYNLSLTYKEKTNHSIVYDNAHGRVLMKLSFMINMVIPLMTHYIYIKNINIVNDFILMVDDYILSTFDVDIYNKLYETASFNISKSVGKNSTLWDKQDIRGKNVVTHTLFTVESLLLNVVPKYTYNKNVIFFNYSSINFNIGFQITDIGLIS